MSKKSIFALLASVLLGFAAPVAAAPFAYVVNQEIPPNLGTVSVIDTATNTVVDTVTVGTGPVRVAITPDGAFAYVTNGPPDNTVSVIDTATNTVVATVPVGEPPPVDPIVGGSPSGVAVTPDGAFAYVANSHTDLIRVIATATNTVFATVDVFPNTFPVGLAVTPDGDFVYVATGDSDTVTVIETATNTVVAAVPVVNQPLGVAFTPDGAFAYTANRISGDVSVIDTASNTVVGSPIPAGTTPNAVAITPDGLFAYVVNITSADVTVIDTTSNTVAATVPVGASPHFVAFTPDGAFAYVSNNVDDTVSVIDTATMAVVGMPIPVGVHPRGVAITAGNEPPVADAGPDQPIRAGDVALLDGSASFDDNTSSEDLDYAWVFLSVPLGSVAVLSGADTSSPSFVADVPGTYVVELTVTDEGGLSSAPDEVEVSSDNLAPTAAAGDDQLVIVGTTALLDGSASSDPEFDPLSFSWTITAAPAGSTATLVNPSTDQPDLTPDLEGVYQVTLVVSDFIGPGAPDTVEVTATNAETFAEVQIQAANDFIASLPEESVTTQGNQNALTNFLSQAVVAIQKGNLSKAFDKLDKAIARTDGCVLRGSPDGNGPGRDWITDCAAQSEAYDLLTTARDALS